MMFFLSSVRCMNCRRNEDRAPVSTIVQPLRQKAFFPLMPLPFEPLIHFNPNVFRQKRECKLYLCQCATVLRLYNFISYSFGCSSIRCLCHYYVFFFSCLLILPQPLFTIYSFLSNKWSFIIAVCLFSYDIYDWIDDENIYLKRGRKK